MEVNTNSEEDDNQHIESRNSTDITENDEENLIEISQLAAVTRINLNRNEHDLFVIHNKRQELDSIQSDLNDLMYRLNSFIADAHEDIASDEESVCLEEEEENVTEKQDGPSEKELRSNMYASGDCLVDKIYTTDGLNPPEINWGAIGPILQKHVADLQRLHNLNQMTHAVVRRIRNVTQTNEDILKEVKRDHDV